MGLAALLTSYRTALAAAPASLTNLPEFADIDDLPDTKKTYFALTLASHGALGPTYGAASLVEYVSELLLELAWFVDVDREALYNTIATDVENVSAVMLKVSNRNSTTLLVSPGEPIRFERFKNWIKGTGTFTVRERVVQDLS